MGRYLKPVHCRRNRAIKLSRIPQHLRLRGAADVCRLKTQSMCEINSKKLIWVLITNQIKSVASIRFCFYFYISPPLQRWVFIDKIRADCIGFFVFLMYLLKISSFKNKQDALFNLMPTFCVHFFPEFNSFRVHH